jgi:hypothetical protein
MRSSILALLLLASGLDSQTAMVCSRNSTIQGRIQESIRTQERKCKLKAVRKNRVGAYTYYDWECQGETVSALISVHSSMDRASEVFKALPDTFEENGLKMKVKQRNVAGLGNENYFWMADLNPSITGVDFRSNCVVVHVGSSSAERAYQFAQYIADAISSVN